MAHFRDGEQLLHLQSDIVN
uniref:Uncharacterized protein n=1 Tax=Anguilla anguilla TaxID=7936 RepID=A0A0E9S3X0_ANGAN